MTARIVTYPPWSSPVKPKPGSTAWPHADWIDAGVLGPAFTADPWQTIVACTDGGYTLTRGVGAYAVVMRVYDTEMEVSCAAVDETNIRMEMRAIIQALQAHPSRPLVIITDSLFTMQGACAWLPRWQAAGWVTSQGRPVANRDLWEDLDRLQREDDRHVHYHHVRGHKGHPGNARADALGTQATAAQLAAMLTPA